MLFAGLLKPAIVGGLASLILSLYVEQRTKMLSRRVFSKISPQQGYKASTRRREVYWSLIPIFCAIGFDQNIGSIVRKFHFYLPVPRILYAVSGFSPRIFFAR